jgi:MFS family permease
MMSGTTPRVRSDTLAGGYVKPLLTVFLGWLWLMTGANLAAPLYAVYAAQFGFSSLVLTTIFATYAVTLVITLTTCGRLSDRYGRRPVMASGLLVGAVSLVVFAAADATGWLYVARALQGVAVGLVSGPATAALVEIDPRRAERRPALLAGLAQAVGSGGGPLIAGALAEWAPFPLHLPFAVGLAGTLVALAFVLVLPEAARHDAEPWRIQWPRIPDRIRVVFWRLGLTGGLVWASLALYLSVVPSYVADLLDTSNLALIGATSALPCLASAATQLGAQRYRGDAHGAQAAGLVLLAAGLALLVVSADTHLLVTVLVGAVVTGVGHGLAFLHAQDELNRVAPDETRGEVSAAFACCIYALVGTAVVGVGLLDEVVALTTAVGIVGVLLAVGALGAAAWSRGQRPTA